MTKFIVACIAVTVVGIVAVAGIVVISGPERPPRFTTISSAIEEGAEVLAADKDGAVTMTANGRIRGFSRAGEKLWERKFDRYEPNKRVLLEARATCAVKCPAALLELPTGYEGAGGADPAGSLSRALSNGDMQLLAAAAPAELFARAPTNNGSTLRTIFTTDLNQPTAPTEQNVGVAGPGYVSVAAGGGRGVVGSLVSDPAGKPARIQAIEGSAGDWNPVGPAIPDIESANACISADGSRIAIASDRLRAGEFGSKPDRTYGPALSRGSCTIDGSGLSALMLPRGAASGLIAARYDFDGRQLWRRELGAVRVISDADAKYFVVREESTSVTSVLDVVNGRKVFEAELPPNLFAADDGSLVTANRSGTPTWVSARSP